MFLNLGISRLEHLLVGLTFSLNYLFDLLSPIAFHVLVSHLQNESNNAHNRMTRKVAVARSLREQHKNSGGIFAVCDS